MRTLAALLVSFAFALPAQALVASTTTHLSTAPRLLARDLAPPLDGAGDGILTGISKTIGWTVGIVGAVAVVGGVLAIERDISLAGLDPKALGVGAIVVGLALLSVAFAIIQGSNCVACTTCGIVENDVKPRRSEADVRVAENARDRSTVFAITF